MPLTALSVKKQRVMREVSRTGWRARRGYCEYFLGNQAKAKASESGSTCLGDGLLSAYLLTRWRDCLFLNLLFFSILLLPHKRSVVNQRCWCALLHGAAFGVWGDRDGSSGDKAEEAGMNMLHGEQGSGILCVWSLTNRPLPAFSGGARVAGLQRYCSKFPAVCPEEL